MKAQEWLETHEMDLEIYGECSQHEVRAAAIIRDQQAEINRLTSELAEVRTYKQVIDDALVVANIGVASGDAKADLHKLLMWEVDVALDPRVSKRAADLLAEKDAEIADLRESISRAADAWIECTGYPYPACAEININKLRRELAEAQNIAASRLEVVEKRGKELLAIHKALSGNVNDPDPLHSSPHCLSYPTTYGLVSGIIRERDKLRNLAASRLADQEAIELHTRRVVATECLSIMEASETYEDAVEEIKERYEVG